MSLETQWSEITILDKSPFKFEDSITKMSILHVNLWIFIVQFKSSICIWQGSSLPQNWAAFKTLPVSYQSHWQTDSPPQARPELVGKSNKSYTIGNVMSLAKMLFSRHLNNMPVVGSLMSWNCRPTDLRKLKNTLMGGCAFSLQLRYKYWSEPIQNVDDSISM